MGAVTSSHLPMEDEPMDTTPPSKAVIFQSPPASNHVSTRLPGQSVWGPTAFCNAKGAPSHFTPALPNGQQWPAGCLSLGNPFSSTATVGLTTPTGQYASGTSSSNFPPSTPALVGPAAPLSGGSWQHGMPTQGPRPTAYHYIAGQKNKCSSMADAPINLKRRRV